MEKHSSSGFHYCIPSGAAGCITEGNWLKYHNRLFTLKKVQENVERTIDVFQECEEKIEIAFSQIHRELTEIKEKYISSLHELRADVEKSISNAVNETNAHALDKEYAPTDKIASFIWKGMVSEAIEKLNLYQFEISKGDREDIQQIFVVNLVAKSDWFATWKLPFVDNRKKQMEQFKKEQKNVIGSLTRTIESERVAFDLEKQHIFQSISGGDSEQIKDFRCEETIFQMEFPHKNQEFLPYYCPLKFEDGPMMDLSSLFQPNDGKVTEKQSIEPEINVGNGGQCELPAVNAAFSQGEKPIVCEEIVPVNPKCKNPKAKKSKARKPKTTRKRKPSQSPHSLSKSQPSVFKVTKKAYPSSELPMVPNTQLIADLMQSERDSDDPQIQLLQPESPKTCVCQRPITSDFLQCSGKCICSLCHLKNYFSTKEPICRKCDSQIIGEFPTIVKCSGCLRTLTVQETRIAKQVVGICEQNCILCVYCIVVKAHKSKCSVCKSPVIFPKEEAASVEQRRFELGCYCGDKSKDNTCNLSCRHEVHKSCEKGVYICRICKEVIKERREEIKLEQYLVPANSRK